MLRKVISIEKLKLPYSLIDKQEDYYIIDVPIVYSRVVPLLEDDNPVVKEVGKDEEGHPIYQQLMQVVSYNVDVESIGDSVTWADVTNPFYFDFIINHVVYSWDGREGTTKIQIDCDGTLRCENNQVDIKLFKTLNGHLVINDKYNFMKCVHVGR